MSVLNVCSTTELDREYRRYHRHHSLDSQQQQQQHQQQKFSNLFYRRLYHNHQQGGQLLHSSTNTTTDSSSLSYDNYSSYTSSTKNSSFEVIFSRLLDALIFTSAIAITAYSYLTGSLAAGIGEAPKPVLVGYHPTTEHSLKRHASNNSLLIDSTIHNNSHSDRLQVVDSIEDSKRKRTQEWAEQQIIVPITTTTTNVHSHSHSHSLGSSTTHIHHHSHSHSAPSSQQQKKRSCSAALLLDNKKVSYIHIILRFIFFPLSFITN